LSAIRVILDTGPLVAYLIKREVHHEWALQHFAKLPAPFYTCEPVIAECSFLLKDIPRGISTLMAFLQRGQIAITFSLDSEKESVATLLQKYADVPMSLADACLVRMSEQMGDSVICTLDSDFRVYRKHQRQVIPLIIPTV